MRTPLISGTLQELSEKQKKVTAASQARKKEEASCQGKDTKLMNYRP
jgi:hypothetical protein